MLRPRATFVGYRVVAVCPYNSNKACCLIAETCKVILVTYRARQFDVELSCLALAAARSHTIPDGFEVIERFVMYRPIRTDRQ